MQDKVTPNTADANLNGNSAPRQDASDDQKSKYASLTEVLEAMRPCFALNRASLRRTIGTPISGYALGKFLQAKVADETLRRLNRFTYVFRRKIVLTKALEVERPTGRFDCDPQGIVDMLWHHSKAHVSPDLFKRAIVTNNLCELIESGTPKILYTDFNNALGMLTGAYRKKFGREPHFQELVALVFQIDDTESSLEYEQQAHTFFEFWREWRRIEAPSPEHPGGLRGATDVKLAMKLWNKVRNAVDEDSFCQAMAGDQAALKSIGWAQRDITEIVAQIERHYQDGLDRKPFAWELECIAGSAVAQVESDEEEAAASTQKILDAIEFERNIMYSSSDYDDDEDDEEAED